MLIVTYHAIASPSSPVCCPPEQLEADIRGLADSGFRFVSLDDCADWLEGKGALSSRSVAMTFDDAYASVVSLALPLLKRYAVPATVFVIGNRIGGDNQWPGQWSGVQAMPLADVQQLRCAVDAGIGIGSHSWSHPVLPELDAAALALEVADSAVRLEEALKTPVRHFAYPYGLRGPRDIAAVRARYRTAVSADPYTVRSGADRHDLGRLDCHDLRVALRLRLLDDPVIDPYLAVRRAVRRARRTMDRALGRM